MVTWWSWQVAYMNWVFDRPSHWFLPGMLGVIALWFGAVVVIGDDFDGDACSVCAILTVFLLLFGGMLSELVLVLTPVWVPALVGLGYVEYRKVVQRRRDAEALQAAEIDKVLNE